MSVLSRHEALAELETIRETLRAQVRPDLPSKGRKYLLYVVEEQLDAARLHLEALYDHGLVVGPGLTALPEAEAHPQYAFWIAGIRRHIEQCEASLGVTRASGPSPNPPGAGNMA